MAKHKCKVPDPPADTTRWLGTYGDMVTLLMAFFVMLFAVSETNAAKFEAFVSGLAGPFNNPSVEMGLLEGIGVESSDPNPIDMLAPTTPGRADITSVEQTLTEGGEGEAGARDQLAAVEEQLEAALSDLQLPISADIRDDERGLVVSISTDDVLFATGSSTLSSIGEELIAEIAPVLVEAPNTVVVEGHTDDQPLNQAGYTNWNLSTDRAIAVVQLLGDRHGLPYDRVSAGGYGEHRPLVPNDSTANRAINRRVEILIVALDVAGGGSPPPPSVEPLLDFSEDLPVDRAPTSIASVLGDDAS